MGRDNPIACRIKITGRVQGVGYRNFAQVEAGRNDIAGWVRNSADGDVEIHAEGSRQNISSYINKLHQGPAGSNVENIVTENLVNLKRYYSFEIRH